MNSTDLEIIESIVGPILNNRERISDYLPGHFNTIYSKKGVKKAIKRMIPKGPLGYQQLSNCKIYSGEQHLHSAQNPLTLDISKLNSSEQ